MSARTNKKALEVGDHVMLGSAFVDPVHWHPGIVLWSDGIDVLVEQYGIAMLSPHKMLHPVEYVRAYGSREHCASEKKKAETAVRDAARQCHEIEDMASDLRRKLMNVFELVAEKAIAASDGERGAAAPVAKRKKSGGAPP